MDNDQPQSSPTDSNAAQAQSNPGAYAQTPPQDSGGPPLLPPHRAQPSPSRPQPRKSRAWIALVVLALAVGIGLVEFALSRWTGSRHSGGSGKHGAKWLTEVVMEDNGSRNKIVEIEIGGVISNDPVDRSGHTFVSRIREELDLAAEDEQVKAVVLKIDSPGGEVLASDNIYKAIREFQKESGKPVVALMGSVAASGGYYVAAPCRWIVANELTITGSIGVIMHSYNYRGLMDKVGVRPEVFKSGRFKDMLSGEKAEISPEENAMVQEMINETFQRFKSVVVEGRNWSADLNKGEGRKLAADWEKSADGRIVSGKQALQIGLIDELGDEDKAYEKALNLSGAEDANIVRYAQQFEFGSLLKLFGSAEGRSSMKIDLGIDIPRLNAGRLYFLSEHLFQGQVSRNYPR